VSEADYQQFLSEYRNSAAYHEAGHMSAAVLQGMPLQDRGLHVDPNGRGIAYYWQREPGDPGMTEQDQIERKRTIVAIYAAHIAQEKVFPDCPEHGWTKDRDTVRKLLVEMHPNDTEARGQTASEMWDRAEKLVALYWNIIEAQAKALLAKSWTPQPPVEIQENWSQGEATTEKQMTGAEIVAFFEGFGIPAAIRQLSQGTCDSTTLAPYYDSLA